MAKHVTIKKLTVVVICLTDKYNLHRHYYLINGVYSWFLEGKEFLMVHIVQDGITFRTSFPHRL